MEIAKGIFIFHKKFLKMQKRLYSLYLIHCNLIRVRIPKNMC